MASQEPVVPSAGSASSGGVKIKKRKNNASNLRAKKTRIGQDDDEEEEEEDAETLSVPKAASNKWSSSHTSTGSISGNSSVANLYVSNRDKMAHSYAGDSATAVSEVDTATDRDARAVLEKKLNAEELTQKKASATFGPMRAPAFLRATSVFDYQPDICKDYKETGFCGYGDNCKFLHDRSDYKAGWQLEREWEQKQKALENKKKLQFKKAAEDVGLNPDEVGGLGGDDNDEEEENYEIGDGDEFPFACFICRENFTDPVVTLCGHYFCKECVVTRNKTNNKCVICNKNMFGIFNTARKLIKHIEALKGSGSSSSSSVDGQSVATAATTGNGPRIRKPVTSGDGGWETVTD